MNEFDGSGRMRARPPRSQGGGADDTPCRISDRRASMNIERRGNPTMPFFRQNSQSHQCPLPAEYRGAPMAEGKDRAPHARRRGLATVLLTALLSLAA